MGSIPKKLGETQLDRDATLYGEVFHVVPEKAHDYMAVRFMQKLPNNQLGEFATDLGRLSYIAERADAYAAGGETDWRSEKVGNTTASYLLVKDPATEKPNVYVHLWQKDDEGTQEVVLDRPSLDKVARLAEREAERHGLDMDSRFVVVDRYSLAREPDGRITADVVKSFRTEEEARDFLGRNKGVALCDQQQRGDYQRGETVELFPAATVLVEAAHTTRTVEQQLAECQWSNERRSEHFVVAEWKFKDHDPVPGGTVPIHGGGYEAANGNPVDYTVEPTDRRLSANRGLWVVIEKDPNHVGLGVIQAVSHDRGEMVAELSRLEGQYRAVRQEWTQQQFQMDRQEHTRGHTL
jgi:hypothetical protein